MRAKFLVLICVQYLCCGKVGAAQEMMQSCFKFELIVEMYPYSKHIILMNESV